MTLLDGEALARYLASPSGRREHAPAPTEAAPRRRGLGADAVGGLGVVTEVLVGRRITDGDQQMRVDHDVASMFAGVSPARWRASWT